MLGVRKEPLNKNWRRAETLGKIQECFELTLLECTGQDKSCRTGRDARGFSRVE